MAPGVLSVLACVGALLPPSGVPRGTSHHVRSSWPALDDRRDAQTLRREALRVFERLDVNRDGWVCLDDLQCLVQYEPRLLRKILYKLDTNFDGCIDLEEFVTGYIQHPTLRTAPGFGGTIEQDDRNPERG